MTNCKNCGAVLHNSKCDYCKTEYGEKEAGKRYDFNFNPPKKKITQEQFDDAFSHKIAEYVAKRGSIYLSPYVSSLLETMGRHYDLSEIDINKPFIIKDPANIKHESPIFKLFKIKKGVKP